VEVKPDNRALWRRSINLGESRGARWRDKGGRGWLHPGAMLFKVTSVFGPPSLTLCRSRFASEFKGCFTSSSHQSCSLSRSSSFSLFLSLADQALFDFSPEEADELQLKIGDTVEVDVQVAGGVRWTPLVFSLCALCVCDLI
jgi:hypothetical protein